MKKSSKKLINKIIIRSIFVFILLLLALFLIRLVSPRHLDDVTPGIPCADSLLKKPDILFVIPLFENKSIADDRAWCDYILSLNKTLALHGVHHTYEEFLTARNENYLKPGEEAFKSCFGFNPEQFKPPQLAISKENILWLKQKYKLSLPEDAIFHKSYHCNDSGVLPNWLVSIV